jgi:hypothetical protein
MVVLGVVGLVGMGATLLLDKKPPPAPEAVT